jgi:hypothetical protein
MTPTTPETIKADLIAQILAITPSHTAHQDDRWVQAHSVEDAFGGTIRTFHVMHTVGEPSDLLVSGGWPRRYRMLVWTSYAGLQPDEDDSIIERDAVQLGNAFVKRMDPTVNGLLQISPREQDWIEHEESDDGKRFGAHAFWVHYLADATE